MSATDLRLLRDDVDAYAARVAATAFTDMDAMNVVRDLAAIRSSLYALEALAAARIAAGNRWRTMGAASAADWVARTVGITAHDAQQMIATGKRLDELTATRAAALSGALSKEQLTAVADAASRAPDKERDLLGYARRDSLSELRQHCLRVKAAVDPQPAKTYERVHRRRRLTTGVDAEGAGFLHLRTTPDALAEIRAEIERRTDTLFREARKDGRREPLEAYAADALSDIVRRSREYETRDPTAKKSRAVPVRYLALLRFDLESLIRGHVEGDEIVEIAGIGPIPVHRAREMLGDAVIQLVLTRGRDANVTHLGRGANAAQNVALAWRHPVCSVKGCGRRVRLENDHSDDYARTRHTTLSELRRFCHHHHRLKTTRGWDLIEGPGPQPMVPPNDPRHPRFPRHKPPPEAGAANHHEAA